MIPQLIDEIIQRESVKDTDNPADSGGRTKFGISEKWHPEAWKNGPPTRDQAIAIYTQEYFVGPHISQIVPTYLQSQVADWAVTSGPTTAIQHFQKVLGLNPDGQLGPDTLTAIMQHDPLTINNKLVDDHILFIDRIVQKRPSDIQFVFGWHTRALSFRK